MGVWDETCGLTNTPIGEQEGAPCVLVLLDPSVERDGLRRDWSFADQILAIHKGHYNGYGGVDGVVPDRDEAAAVLFHRDAWDACVAREGAINGSGVAEASRKLAGKPPVPLLAEFVAVLNVADGARRDVLSGLRFRGQQDDPRTATYRFVADLAERHLRRLEGGVMREDKRTTWRLSPGGGALLRAEVPAGRPLGPGEYASLDEAVRAADPYRHWAWRTSGVWPGGAPF